MSGRQRDDVNVELTSCVDSHSCDEAFTGRREREAGAGICARVRATKSDGEILSRCLDLSVALSCSFVISQEFNGISRRSTDIARLSAWLGLSRLEPE